MAPAHMPLFAPTASLHNARAPPDAVFSEPVNNNISEDNNNGPISLREMQNIANNNAAAYIVSENEERNRISRESVVEFEPLPADLRVIDPLERCADWFGGEDLSRNRLQYLREIGRGWFGRVVEGELDNTSTSVAVKILNQNASLEDKARFLDEARIYRDARHENILGFIAKCLQEDPWILLFELCSVDLQQYLIVNRPKMAILNESGVPLQLMCDVSSALAYLHSRGLLYGTLWCGSVMVREGEPARAVLGQYGAARPPHDTAAPETRRYPAVYNSNSEVWSLGTLIWEICAWGAQPHAAPPPLPDLPCPYRTHLYQVMQLCWNANPEARPTAGQVHALLNHLHSTHAHSRHVDAAHDDGYGSSDFEERWQRLKPNSIPKIDEHVAIVHAPSTSMTSHFNSEQDLDNPPTTHDTLSVDLDTAVSRSSSIMSDKDPLSIQIKSESLTNLHGSLEDVRNIYLTHNETAAIECHQGNVSLDDSKDKDYDRSDSSMDPWVKDIITGSQDDVRYYKDVSDVIKNLDNILNSEKTSSSESSHQASPSRDNLSLECKKDYPVQKSLVKSPGITNFQNILEVGFDSETRNDTCEDEGDRETIGTLSHSFERHSDTISQNTLENLTPDTPTNDLVNDTKIICEAEIVQMDVKQERNIEDNEASDTVDDVKSELPNDKMNHSLSEIPTLKELCVATVPSVSEVEQKNVREDCHTPCDNKINDIKIEHDAGTKSVNDVTIESEEYHNTESPTLAITELELKKDTEVQNNINHEILPVSEQESAEKDNIMSLVINDSLHLDEVVNDVGKSNAIAPIRSDDNEIMIKDSASEDSHKDLMNEINIEQYTNDTTLHTYFEMNGDNEMGHIDTLLTTDSTIYLDLPSMIKETSSFLESERVMSNRDTDFKEVVSSTPKGSENSFDNQENSNNECQFESTADTKVPEYELGSTLTKLEQRCAPENISPLESPTKSHHTDTYDENSSIVLGPFENCSLELFKAVKSEIVDLPKEEFLAFSSNFSEMDLETPSPLRDGNFLNEVPDIVHDDLVFDDLATVSETKPSPEVQSDNTENTYEKSNTEKHISPSTPPNSPGIFLASTSQQKYLVDIDLNTPNESAPRTFSTLKETAGPPFTPDSGLSSLQKEIDLNQIELQITTKLAMAENENNLNIEYSGPLTVEGFVTEDEVLMRESDAMPESYLAGNGIPLDDVREDLTLDTECVKALRDELELKLPLAQVAAIEPAESAGDVECPGEVVGEWRAELPPPPDLVLSYPGALSPIAEETGPQLSAYENDTNWISTRTESSESYPEPCNNSTDDVTELPTGAHSGPNDHSTYTLHSRDNSLNLTYTVHKDVASSKEITMSADSLNASPLKKLIGDPLSPIDDRTYNKSDDEKQSNCERLSQVSPFLLSPTTDTSAPDNSDNLAGCSTLSKPTVPTDAKSSKPSETQCLSKATSIDSWCSNDTLYNVEENFDDLAMDPDVPIDFEVNQEQEKDDKSESTDTLTHNEQEKELSHCSTYIIHDSKSEICETFSPDSITANFNTYTKPKTEAGATTSVQTKSELNDSTKNTQTKDLAYGTLMSGLPSGSNCSTELLSTADEAWKLSQPELVRRSPFGDDFNSPPPKSVVDKEEECLEINSPITNQPSINKMDSVDVTCLKDNSDSDNKSEMDSQDIIIGIDESQDLAHKTIANSHVTSTPLSEINADEDNIEGIPINLPQMNTDNSEYLTKNLPNFQSFLLSAEMRPQDISSSISNEVTSLNQDTEVLLEGESKSLSRNSKDSPGIPDGTLTYSDFEGSVITKPQEIDSRENSRDNGTNAQDNSTPLWQQNLSSLIDASSSLLQNERRINEIIMQAIDNSNQSESLINCNTPYVVTSPPSEVYLNESHINDINKSNDIFITDLDTEEETEQPHSIIITESPLLVNRISPNINRNCDPQSNIYDSNTGLFQPFIKERIEQNVLENDRTSQEEHTTEDVRVSVNESNPNTSNCSKDTDNIRCNGDSQNYATVSFLNEAFEELVESNVDDNEKDLENSLTDKEIHCTSSQVEKENGVLESHEENIYENVRQDMNGVAEADDETMTSVTENFLQNEKKYCTLDYYLPLMNDIRFTGPGAEVMSTSFNQDSSTDPTSPECEQDSKPDTVTDILKEWDSESDSHSTNSSSGEFIWRGTARLGDTGRWAVRDDTVSHNPFIAEAYPLNLSVPPTHRDGATGTLSLSSATVSHNPAGGLGPSPLKVMDGDGNATCLVSTTHFQHHREGGAPQAPEGPEVSEMAEHVSSGSSGSSGSEGDEVESVPSSWDCRAAPAKSSLRSLDHTAPDSKKRVVFKRQKYHSVYEYPREVCEATVDAPPDLPDFSTYCDWEAASAEEAELDYGQLFSEHNALDLYPLRSGIAFGADYDEDFFISSSTRPFEREFDTLGVMSTASQFFPGMHAKQALLDHDVDDVEDFRAPPSPAPLPPTALAHTTTPSLDFTTPDSGVEDVTPGSTSTEEDFKTKKIADADACWRPLDSASSSESVSPSSPGGEALGGLRHTRDKLKLDLPPSPHIPSPRHNRVFNFVLDKPKRRSQEERPELGTTPLVMTDETPVITSTLPLRDDVPDDVIPEPTFSTFGKCASTSAEPEQRAIVLTDEVHDSDKEDSSNSTVEGVKGEGTVLDSGDEDSGIERSSKATLERNKTTPNVS
ncbi:Serine/threonine-protein kinase LMTK2 [Papilio xuthus]|uniref:Serine/threonine-protein kinase LMTK2 n=1 Tax=Papilio xuthus TaxID=66420 RepID=A0A194QCB4_PAPXU|nr:Serine/threonine-protein kinase LMTK2 [Papilio xuthus]